MPTYDYFCRNCEHKFEMFQTISEKRKRTCPKCGKKKLVRLIGTGLPVVMTGRTWTSWAMAVDPSQIEEAKKRFPGSRYLPDGRLTGCGRAEKVKRLHERGLVEFTKPDLERRQKNGSVST